MKVKEIIKTKVNINFSDCIVDIFVYKFFSVYKTEREQEIENEIENDIEDETGIYFIETQNSLIQELTKEVPQILLSEKFEISKDYNFIMINNNKHVIPDFFNKKMMKEKNANTWEIIFYYLFRNEIRERVKLLKTQKKPDIISELYEYRDIIGS